MSKLNWALLVVLCLTVMIGIRPDSYLSREPSNADFETWQRSHRLADGVNSGISNLPPVDLIHFTDPLIGFDARVPLGWYRNVLAQGNEPGYTVSFESPPANDSDRFSDYLMLEVLPGGMPTGLNMPIEERLMMVVAGREVFRERVRLDQYAVGSELIDLIAWQIRFADPHLSFGIYVVGEADAAHRLERLLIEFAHSLELNNPPFIMT